MQERVSVRIGTSRVLLVCPHGHDLDDTNTNILTMEMADLLDCHAVVNNGWKRSPAVDALKSLANCNDIDHCSEPVVKEEFLEPIAQYIGDILESINDNYDEDDDPSCLCLLIHGIGNSVRHKVGDPDLDIIVGFGNGHQPRYTVDLWRKDAFVDLLNTAGIKTCEGGPGGNYSARSKTNMTQALHRMLGISCMQVEVIYERRSDESVSNKTAFVLADVVRNLLSLKSYKRPSDVKVEEI